MVSGGGGRAATQITNIPLWDPVRAGEEEGNKRNNRRTK